MRVRNQILTRSNGFCEVCGQPQPHHMHHRRPRGMGGSKHPTTNTAANALHVCVDCHRDIESDRQAALRFGWLVRQGQAPDAVKVLRKGEWVRLADDGWMH